MSNNRLQLIKWHLPALLGLIALIMGCSTTSQTAKTEWSVENVGKGMQVGASSTNAGPFGLVIFGTGFMIEKIGVALNSDDKRVGPTLKQQDDEENKPN